MVRGTLIAVALIAGVTLLILSSLERRLDAARHALREFQNAPSWSPMANLRDIAPDFRNLIP